jgi:hypothetical protein
MQFPSLLPLGCGDGEAFELPAVSQACIRSAQRQYHLPGGLEMLAGLEQLYYVEFRTAQGDSFKLQSERQ